MRLERSLGVGDWRDGNGRIYDDCSPARSPFFDAQRWADSLNNHLFRKQGVHVVTVDLRGRDLTQDQLAQATAVLNGRIALRPPGSRDGRGLSAPRRHGQQSLSRSADDFAVVPGQYGGARRGPRVGGAGWSC